MELGSHAQCGSGRVALVNAGNALTVVLQSTTIHRETRRSANRENADVSDENSDERLRWSACTVFVMHSGPGVPGKLHFRRRAKTENLDGTRPRTYKRQSVASVCKTRTYAVRRCCWIVAIILYVVFTRRNNENELLMTM